MSQRGSRYEDVCDLIPRVTELLTLNLNFCNTLTLLADRRCVAA